MLLALAVTLGSVALGAVLGTLSTGASGRALGPIQLFAIAAAVAVVALHLLPEAYAEKGPLTLLVLAAAVLVPLGIDWLGRRLRQDGGRELGLEIGYAGLLVHKVGDGFALGAATGPLAITGYPAGVVFAVAGHTVPLTALVVLAFQRSRSTRHAWIRASGLALAMVAGVGLAAAVPPARVAPWHPWLAAAVAGLLLHVVTHGWHPVRPGTPLGWAAHGVAVVLGVAIVWAGGH